MNIRNSMSVLATACVLAIVASLVELTLLIHPTLAYFSIALLAAIVTLMLPARQTTRQRSKPTAVNSTRGTAATSASTGGTPASHGALGKETGNVKWFSPSKGFGFITRDNGEDIFVHFRSISGNGHRILREGQRVEFAVTEGNKGPQAEDVVALK